MGLMGKGRWFGAMFGALLFAGTIAGCGVSDSDGDSNTIPIGANFAMSGSLSNYGSSAFDGLRFAVEEVNKAGGIDGKQIKVIGIDDKSNPSDVVNVAKKLISDYHVKAIVGPVASNLVLAEEPTTTEAKIPLIAPGATNNNITQNDDGSVKPYVFRSCFTNEQEGTAMATFARNTLKAKTATMCIEDGSEYAADLGRAFKKHFEAMGGKVIEQESFAENTKDFQPMLTKIKAANADVIFLPAYYEQVGEIVKQARTMGIIVPVLGSDSWDDDSIVDLAGVDALNNTYYCSFFVENDPNVKDFVNAFSAEYGHSPNVFTAMGYDAGKMLIAAIKRAGSDDPDKIREALEQTKDVQGSNSVLTLDEHHNPVKETLILELRSGIRVVREKIAAKDI